MKVHGSCHCGQITYQAEIDPDRVGLCHCTDCQMLTGSAFRVAVAAPSAGFQLLSGTPTTYIKTADSGTRRRHAFCPVCGTPVYACAETDAPPSYSLRVGCLQERAQLSPRRQIWCRSALPWTRNIAEIPGSEGQ
jgi:hypothetical protein